jgi:hypothetical protein
MRHPCPDFAVIKKVTKKEFVLFYNNLVSRLLSVQVSPHCRC